MLQRCPCKATNRIRRRPADEWAAEVAIDLLLYKCYNVSLKSLHRLMRTRVRQVSALS